MIKKRFTPPVLVLLAVLIIFSVTSCKDKPVEAPHVHAWDEGTVTTPSTCIKEGVRTFKCTGCDETRTEPIAKLSHSFDETTGKCSICQGYKAGDNVAAVYDSTEKTLLVTGSGDMTDYTYDSSKKKSTAPWAEDDVTKVIIDDGVTSVSNNAFYGMDKITDVLIGKDVKSIKHYTFYGCSSLENLTFADGSALETIGFYSFYKCIALKSIKLSEGLVTIGPYAFTYTAIEVFDIPASLDFSKSAAFWNPDKLTAVNVDAGNTSAKSVDGVVYSIDGKTVIGVPANKTGYTIPSEVEAIGSYAFSCWNGTTITIPGSVKTIGQSAFYYTDITSIELPESVTSIGMNAFQDCHSLLSVDIKSSQVNAIGQNAFLTCIALKSIRINMPESAKATLDTKNNNWSAPTGATVTWYGTESTT